VVAFGAAYAVASLTCSIAPFLALVVASFRGSSVLEGVALFIAYALGMGLLVGTAAVAVALAKSSLISQMRRAGRFVPAFAGALMIIVGAYVGYYGWWEIRVLGGGPAEDLVIEAAVGGAASCLQRCGGCRCWLAGGCPRWAARSRWNDRSESAVS
jgi:cytochrome c-type biogenesis protein